MQHPKFNIHLVSNLFILTSMKLTFLQEIIPFYQHKNNSLRNNFSIALKVPTQSLYFFLYNSCILGLSFRYHILFLILNVLFLKPPSILHSDKYKKRDRHLRILKGLVTDATAPYFITILIIFLFYFSYGSTSISITTYSKTIIRTIITVPIAISIIETCR